MNNLTIEESGIELTPEQQDVLNELINIGFGRAASSLSMLVNQRVLLSVPQLRICSIEKMDESLNELLDKEIINVHQVFQGKLAGHAMLLMDVRSASVLVDLLNGGEGKEGHITAIYQEALAEVGNILVNAFLGAFGNLLKIHIAFTVPALKVETLVQLIRYLSKNDSQDNFAMVVKIRFQLSQRDVTGYLVVVMGAEQLETLMTSMQESHLF